MQKRRRDVYFFPVPTVEFFVCCIGTWLDGRADDAFGWIYDTG